VKAKFVAAALAAALAGGVPLVLAQDKPAAKSRAGMQMEQKMQEQMMGRMKTMQAQLDRIHQSTDPVERQKLIQEHMKSMQETMQAMRGMGGGMIGKMGHGAMAGGGMTGGSRGAGPSMEMMEQRMDMMQMMMEQMMQHQQMMQSAPGR
jgi:hypothetical protein